MSFRDEMSVIRLVVPQGRRGRLSYLLAPLAVYATVVALVVGGVIVAEIGAPIASTALFIAGSVVGLAAFWIGIAVSVQRLHDLNFSGLWILLAVAAGVVQAAAGELTGSGGLALVGFVVGLAFTLWLLFARGTDGPNRFGPPPTWPA
jgi:uncharacterized membrane protein YhaH (DUF805 family)